MQIVDAHQHFWDPVANYHPWLRDEPLIPFRYGDYRAIRRRYLPPALHAQLRVIERRIRIVFGRLMGIEWKRGRDVLRACRLGSEDVAGCGRLGLGRAAHGRAAVSNAALVLAFYCS